MFKILRVMLKNVLSFVESEYPDYSGIFNYLKTCLFQLA